MNKEDLDIVNYCIEMVKLEQDEREQDKKDGMRNFIHRSILFDDEELHMVLRALRFYKQKGGKENA